VSIKKGFIGVCLHDFNDFAAGHEYSFTTDALGNYVATDDVGCIVNFLAEGINRYFDFSINSGIKSDTVEDTLKERGSRYGEFKYHAGISQKLKSIMYNTSGWDGLNNSQKESLEMIQHKVARVLNGDPNYDDNWKDIAGYSTLVFQELNNASS